MTIADYYDEISHCNKCGFCQVACPIFRSTGHESGVARGRLALLRAIIEGRIDWSEGMEGPLFDCLLCGACTANCFPAIPTSDLVIRARSEYLARVGRKPVHRLLFEHLLPYPDRLQMAAMAVSLGQKTGLSNLARALGLLRIFGRDFASAEEILGELPGKPFRSHTPPGRYKGSEKGPAVGYFIGCGIDIIQQSAGAATLQLLRKVSRRVEILDNCCCGLPAFSYGDFDAARRLLQKNLRSLAFERYDAIVTDCSSCASYLKKYPDIISENDPRHERARAVALKVQDLVEFAGSMPIPTPSSKAPIRVTYHDPCHAVRGQDLSKPPREMLEKLPGVEYRELPEADWCCGGAGAYALSQYDLYSRVLDRKITNVESTGADLLVTSCPACVLHLSHGVRRHGLKTRVCHISEVILSTCHPMTMDPTHP